VRESDESDGSFALLSPEITIITNLDKEHLDYYRDLAHVQEMFAAYLQRLPEGCQGHRLRRRPAPGPGPRPLPPGAGHLQPQAGERRFLSTDLTPQGLGYRFRLWRRGAALGTVALPLAGSHYV